MLCVIYYIYANCVPSQQICHHADILSLIRDILSELLANLSLTFLLLHLFHFNLSDIEGLTHSEHDEHNSITSSQ